jgi:hypothetical protein
MRARLRERRRRRPCRTDLALVHRRLPRRARERVVLCRVERLSRAVQPLQNLPAKSAESEKAKGEADLLIKLNLAFQVLARERSKVLDLLRVIRIHLRHGGVQHSLTSGGDVFVHLPHSLMVGLTGTAEMHALEQVVHPESSEKASIDVCQ